METTSKKHVILTGLFAGALLVPTASPCVFHIPRTHWKNAIHFVKRIPKNLGKLPLPVKIAATPPVVYTVGCSLWDALANTREMMFSSPKDKPSRRFMEGTKIVKNMTPYCPNVVRGAIGMFILPPIGLFTGAKRATVNMANKVIATAKYVGNNLDNLGKQIGEDQLRKKTRKE
ncbi:MAG: hypothetical protein M1549_02830 [Candidatus Dependentiae bacterium]|nr:hypothetical protein [Candidatus Dependentiae bacterium]